MPITLSPETTKKLQASIKRYAAEHLDEEMRVEDLEGVCHQAEFTYWPPAGRGEV